MGSGAHRELTHEPVASRGATHLPCTLQHVCCLPTPLPVLHSASPFLQDVSITDIKFGREFELAVERKQVAQQEAERARFIVEKAQQDKLSIIIKAQGEATSAEMIGMAAANNPGFVQLRRLDAAREVAQLLATSANTVYPPSETLLLNLNTPATTSEATAATMSASAAARR